jgi:RNA polymerase sigma-70 factor (ECF subfamily)
MAALTEEILTAAFEVIEQLERDARIAFLLHDIFGAALAEVARTLGTSEPDRRLLLESARRQVGHRPDRRTP